MNLVNSASCSVSLVFHLTLIKSLYGALASTCIHSWGIIDLSLQLWLGIFFISKWVAAPFSTWTGASQPDLLPLEALIYIFPAPLLCVGQRKLATLLAKRYTLAEEAIEFDIQSSRCVVIGMDCWSKKGLSASFLAIYLLRSSTMHLINQYTS
jgi:hypothetical protein